MASLSAAVMDLDMSESLEGAGRRAGVCWGLGRAAARLRGFSSIAAMASIVDVAGIDLVSGVECSDAVMQCGGAKEQTEEQVWLRVKGSGSTSGGLGGRRGGF